MMMTDNNKMRMTDDEMRTTDDEMTMR